MARVVRVIRQHHAALERHNDRWARPALLSSYVMTLIKSYGTRVEADLARIELAAHGITATVVGIGVAMEGGAEGVRLLVPDDQADAAREVLGGS